MTEKNVFLDFLQTYFLSYLKFFILKISNHTKYINCSKKINFYVNISVSLTLICIFIVIIAFFFNVIYSLINKNSINKIYIYINMVFMALLYFFSILKFYISLKFEKSCGILLYDEKAKFYNNNKGFVIEYFSVFSSSLSDVIILLCLITGVICLDLLGNKNFFKKINNIVIFFSIVFFVILMVNSNNLLIMFLSFEFIFLPTIYFVFDLGYMKKTEKSGITLFYWTLSGSFLIFCALVYIYYNYLTLNYFFLANIKLSNLEVTLLLLVLLVGFGVKIPLIPFHFWLLKVHVEAPTGFSIFLSGFLVKSALYCLFMFLNIFNNNEMFFFITMIIFSSLIVSCCGLATVIDIKKLIAWATVQEMTFMLFFIFLKQSFFNNIAILFILLHGFMSIYMFYLVDIIQRRYNIRSLQNINGSSIFLPKLTKYIWFLILLFGGFPLSAKFLIEWSLISFFSNTKMLYLFIFCFFVNFLGAILFIKHLLVIMYGVPKNTKDLEFLDIQPHESNLLNFLICLIFIIIIFIYLIKWIKKQKNFQTTQLDE